jgi:hypothetical protein
VVSDAPLIAAAITMRAIADQERMRARLAASITRGISRPGGEGRMTGALPPSGLPQVRPVGAG